MSNLHGKSQKKLDWKDIYERLATSQSGVNTEQVGEEALKQMWDRRAADLALPLVVEKVGEQIEIALARVGRELYGLEARFIFAIRPANGITRVPRVPDWVAGVVNVRGRIYSAIRLKRFLGLPEDPESQPGSSGIMVVVEVPEIEAVLLVEDLLGVETFPVDEIRDAAGIAHTINPQYVRGVIEWKTATDFAPVTILNLPVLLSDKRLTIHEEML